MMPFLEERVWPEMDHRGACRGPHRRGRSAAGARKHIALPSVQTLLAQSCRFMKPQVHQPMLSVFSCMSLAQQVVRVVALIMWLAATLLDDVCVESSIIMRNAVDLAAHCSV